MPASNCILTTVMEPKFRTEHELEGRHRDQLFAGGDVVASSWKPVLRGSPPSQCPQLCRNRMLASKRCLQRSRRRTLFLPQVDSTQRLNQLHHGEGRVTSHDDQMGGGDSVAVDLCCLSKIDIVELREHPANMNI